jgi:hypothetical protein
MYDFIFLGLIPGTHIQVTFSLWLCIAGAIACALVARRTIRNRTWRFPYQNGKFLVPTRRQHSRI